MYIILFTAVWRVRRLAGCCRWGHACCRRICCRPTGYGYARRRSKRTRICAIILLLSYVVQTTYKSNLLCSRCTRFGRSSSWSLKTGEVRQMRSRVYFYRRIPNGSRLLFAYFQTAPVEKKIKLKLSHVSLQYTYIFKRTRVQ